MEIAVTKRAVGIVNDLDRTPSYLDQYLSLDKFYEIDGTCYSIAEGRIVCQDYHFRTRIYRTTTGHLKYDSTAVHLSDLKSYSSLDSETVPVTSPPGTFIYRPGTCIKIYFLVCGTQEQLSAVTEEVLTIRCQLHQQIAKKTASYMWLLDARPHYDGSDDVSHPLDLPESMVLQVTTTGTLTITTSTIKRLAYMESTMYRGSCKAWIGAVAQFPLMNPEKARRMVLSIYSVFLALTNLDFS